MLLLNDIKSQQIPPTALTKQKLLITGPVGVGKTTIAKALAAHLLRPVSFRIVAGTDLVGP